MKDCLRFILSEKLRGFRVTSRPIWYCFRFCFWVSGDTENSLDELFWEPFSEVIFEICIHMKMKRYENYDWYLFILFCFQKHVKQTDSNENNTKHVLVIPSMHPKGEQNQQFKSLSPPGKIWNLWSRKNSLGPYLPAAILATTSPAAKAASNKACNLTQ